MRPNIIAILAIGLLLLIAYQVYNGLVFQEIGFGEFSIKFAQPALKTPEALGASRDFFVGRWQVDHQIGGSSGYSDATIIDYFDDGSFSGSGAVIPRREWKAHAFLRSMALWQVGKGQVPTDREFF